jgi:glycosyltransferase involved in cell wall biosynthesis
MRRVIAAIRPDIVHAHYVARYGWLAALTGFRPLVVTVWGSDLRDPEGGHASSLAPLLTPYTLRRAAAITVDAPDLRELCTRMATRWARIETVTFGADFQRFRTGLAVDQLRRRLDIAPGAPVVVSPRIFAPVYNIDTIIESIPAVTERHPDVVFVLQNYSTLANVAYEERLVRLVERLKLAKHVRFANELPHDEMALLYNVANVVVSVPTADGVPATFFEAMGCRAPLVVSDLPAYDGLIQHGVTGLRVPVKNARAVAEAVLTLLDDADFARRMAEAAHAVGREKGDFSREMSRVEAIYVELAARRPV